MVILSRRNRCFNEATNYQNISLSDAVIRLNNESVGREIQCHLGRFAGVGFMEARYNALKINGGEIRFQDRRNVNNRLVICFRDVKSVMIEEDVNVQFVSFRFDMKDNTFVSVSIM